MPKDDLKPGEAYWIGPIGKGGGGDLCSKPTDKELIDAMARAIALIYAPWKSHPHDLAKAAFAALRERGVL